MKTLTLLDSPACRPVSVPLGQIIALALFFLACLGVRADTRTWTGAADPDVDWTNALNWLEGTPPPNPLTFTNNQADGAIVFPGGPGNPNSIVTSNWSVGRLVFPLGANNYVLSGADLILEQGQSGNANYSIHHQGGANAANITFSNNIVFTTNAGPANLRRQVVIDSAAGVLNFNGNIIKSNLGLAEIFFRGNGTEIVNGALLWDTNRVLKTDNAVLVFNNSGNVWGQLVLSVGFVRLGVNNALPTTSSVDYNQSATVNLNLNDFNQTLSFLRNSIIGGAQTLSTGTNAGGTLTLNDNGVTNVVAVVISGNGRLVKAGNGTLTLSGNSTYTGGTAIGGGILQLGNAGGGGSIVGNVTNSASLVLNRTDTSTLAANITGSGALLKLGSGTVALSGNNSFSGSTTVSNGALLVNSTLNNSSSVSVFGGTFGGSGTVGSPVTASGGQVMPGSLILPGTLTVSNLTVNSGGAIGVKLGTTTTVGSGVNDLLAAGTLTLDPASTLSVVALGNLAVGGTYVVATYNSLSGTFGTLSNATRYTLTLDYSVANQIRVQVTGTNASLVWSPSGSVGWDLTTSNWLNSAVRDRFYQGDNVTFDNSPTNFAPSMMTVLLPGVVTVNSSSNYTFAGAGRISGTAGISKSGTGQLLINNAHDYSGQVSVNAGILRAGNATALGLTNGNTLVNGGSFDVGGQNLGFETFVVQGDGVNGTNGAINNAGAAQQSAIRYVTLTGDTLFNASGQRWDMHNTGLTGAQLQGNGFKLTKRGAFDVWIKDVGDTGLGDIEIRQGVLGFQGAPMGLGIASSNLTVFQGGTLGMWDVRSNLLNKNLILTNGSFSSGGSSNNFIGPITLQGTNTIFTDVPLHLWGPISGPGGFNKNNASILYLDGANTYSGVTLLNTSQIILGPNSSLGNSSLIRLNAATTLDATLPGLTLNSGQTLAGSGTILGNVTNNTGSFLSPGTSVGTLSISGDLTLFNTTNLVELGSDPFTIGGTVNDLVSVLGFLNLNGLTTIKILPVAPLSAATPYTVINYASGLNGAAANLQVTSDNPRYSFNVVDPSLTPGFIQISVTGNPTPLIWKGGKAPNPIAWDHTVTNWLNTGTGLFDKFFDGDLVTFDDTAATNLVSVTQTNVAGLAVFTNNTLNYTLTGAGAVGGTFVKEGTGTVTFAFSNPGAFALTFLTNNSGTLAFNMTSNATLSATIGDINGLGGTLLKLNTNELTLAGDNSLFNGPILVASGSLVVTADNALGSVAAGTVVSNGARLFLVGNRTITEPVALNGIYDGVGGALQAGGAATVNQGGTLTLDSASRISSDAGSTLRVQGGINGIAGLIVGGPGNTVIEFGAIDGLIANSLTKVDAGLLAISADSTIYDGPIFLNGGSIRVSSGFALGSPVGATVLQTNTTLDFFFNAPTVNEPITIIGTGTANQGAIHTGGGAGCTPILLGPITLSGDALIKMDGGTILSLSNSVTGNANLGVTIDGNGPCIIEGNVSLGAHSLTKASSGQLVLRGTANALSGPTIIVSGSIALGTGSTLGTSSFIAVGTNQAALLDATLPGLSLGAGQTLAGLGTVRGDTTLGSGATLSAGYNSVGTLTFNTNTLTLAAGSTNAVDFTKSGTVTCDTIANLGTVNMGGTLVVNNLGVNPLAAGDALKLFAATTYTGGFATIVPATPGTGLAWDTSTLNADGTLRVAAAVPVQIVAPAISGTNFVFSGAGGISGGGYSVLSDTNLVTPLTNWSVIATGTFDGSGNFLFTNGITPGEPARFFIIRIP